jgi:predicted dehydrogenase
MGGNEATTSSGHQSRITRRRFLGAAASAAAFTIVPRHVLGGTGRPTPNEKLDIACIGVGGQGAVSTYSVSGENIVALCDVDEERAADTFRAYPEARRYHDFRRMLDAEGRTIDAVVVTTPNHTHIPISVAAMKMGKHVFCEKPLGHNIGEIRTATQVAREMGVATQMGAAAHGSRNYRRVVELIRAGAIGEVGEVHIWCDNEWDTPPRAVADGNALPWGDRRPSDRPPVPARLKWDLWLGPAPYRPYHPAYHPKSWRMWWDFGGGRLGDMGCHLLDLPFWALDLTHPLAVEAEGPGRVGKEVAPPWLISRWTFPPRGALPPVELTWYDGNTRPDLPKELNPPDWDLGVLFVGSEGMLVSSFAERVLLPKDKFADYEPPPETIPNSIGHHEEWIRACKGGPAALCNFDYAGPLTETVLLGTVAYRVGEKLRWDPADLKATNAPEADRFVRREARDGWAL